MHRHYDDFEAICLMRAVLETTLERLKHLVQGIINFNMLPTEPPNEYVFAKIP